MLVSLPSRNFSFSNAEIKQMEIKVKKKLQILRMFTELKDFNYEAPNMTYDKKTGDINITEKKDKK